MGAMPSAGLCSVTFRQLSPREIIALCTEARLDAVEWGGDIHVPTGNVAAAREVGAMCRDAGLRTPSYGSYFRPGASPAADFQGVLDSALALGASTVRIWAGQKSSADLAPAELQRLVAESRAIADLAASAGCRVAFEFHLNTMTDSNATALTLLREVDHPAVSIYWQPRLGYTLEQRLEGLTAILPFLAHLHVFQWLGDDAVERRPLDEGAADWERYLALAAQAPSDPCAFLEFVRGDEIGQFKADAATLRRWLGKPSA
jgi:3-dehydroshikimate dehydratase